MSELQLKKEIADLKKQLELVSSQNDALKLKNLDLEDKNDDLHQLSKKILKDKNEELEIIKAKLMELNLQNANLEKENFELKQQIELDESRTYNSHYSERCNMSEIPSKLNEPQSLFTKQKAKSVQFQDNTDVKENQSTLKTEELNGNGKNDVINRQNYNKICLFNEELQRRNSELMMIVEKNNEVYANSHQILVELNLQTSNLVTEKTLLQQQVADLEDVIEEQQSQLILLCAENKELIQRLEYFSSPSKPNHINTTQGSVVELISNLQQFENNTEQIDWNQSLTRQPERNESNKESGMQFPTQNGRSSHQDNEQNNKSAANQNYSSISNDYRNTQDETLILSSGNFQNCEQPINRQDISSSKIEDQKLISALKQQIAELTSKFQIVSSQLSENEKILLQNTDSLQTLKSLLYEKENKIENMEYQMKELNEKVNHLENEIEIQKEEFDSAIDDLYSQYSQKLSQFESQGIMSVKIAQC